MKRIIILPLLLIPLLFSSCDLFFEDVASERRINLVTIALSYDGTEVSSLDGTLNDGEAVREQFEYISEMRSIPINSYSFFQSDIGYQVKVRERTFPGDPFTYQEMLSERTFKTKIVNILSSLCAASREGDLTIIYYAGHGVALKATDSDSMASLKGAMVVGDITFPSIGDWRTESENLGSILTLGELKKACQGFSGNVLIVLDSCYSGAVIHDDPNISEVFDFASAFSNLFTLEKAEGHNIWELSASREDELSYETQSLYPYPHGKFTASFLSTLGYVFAEDEEYCGLPKLNMITLAEICLRAQADVTDSAQNPDMSQGVQDLVLFEF